MIAEKRLKSGFAMPALGFGTWSIGGKKERDPDNDDEADVRAIRMALDLGLRHIDTAERYAGGHAEELVGKAIEGYDRAALMLTSKVHREHLRADDVQRACETSLGRLNVSYLDLYLVHAFNDSVPLVETIAAMDALVDEGLVKAIGVSNFTPDHLRQAQALASHPIVCNQVHYSLTTREPERYDLVRYCQENDTLLVAYRPLEKGRLGEPECLKTLVEKYRKTTNQVALNWLLSQRNVAALTFTRSLEHLEENLGACGWSMDDEDVEMLRREFPDQLDVSSITPMA